MPRWGGEGGEWRRGEEGRGYLRKSGERGACGKGGGRARGKRRSRIPETAVERKEDSEQCQFSPRSVVAQGKKVRVAA